MPISELAERVRITVYEQLANKGTAPTTEEIGRIIGASSREADTALAELADAHHLVIQDREVVLAHPFATRSFRFSVMGPETLWWGGCAWDAFAIPNLIGGVSSVLVATTCPACETPHAWTVTDEAPPSGDQVAHFLVPADRIWPDAAHACENQQIFCSEDCVTAWLNRTGQTRGYVMSLAQLWRLAEHWYDGRLSSPYERREPSQAADYFRAVGLHGPFWGLPA